MSAIVLNTAIALPAHVHSQEQIRAALLGWLSGAPDKAERAASILAHGEVQRRFTVRPLPWYLEHTSVTERSRVYAEEMVSLCGRAAEEALAGAGVHPRQVGLIISASCTGVMIPSVESHLIPRLGFRPETQRQPVTELGCVAGAWALARADDYLRAYPGAAVLIVAAELASLTAQVGDTSMANIVSAALFGDGVAATVAVGPSFSRNGRSATPHAAAPHTTAPHATVDRAAAHRPAKHRPARILATRSVLFPDTPELMGFDVTDSGLKIVLSPRVPRFIRQHLPGVLAPFLEEHGVRRGDLAHFLLHPGGRKVLEGLERELGLTPQDTRFSWQVLREYGNLSSATVLFLLHHFEREAAPREGDLGLLLAVGPGFCAELVLLQW
jgi:alkylresorcinol/alkylpyrone synthase